MNMYDALAGFLFGMLIAMGVFLGVNEIGRDECEMHLPRTQKCVKKWTPKPPVVLAPVPSREEVSA